MFRLYWTAGVDRPSIARAWSGEDRGRYVHRHAGFGLPSEMHVVVEPGAKIIGVRIAARRYIPTMAVITKQSDADALPLITDQYQYRSLNHAIVHVHTPFADPWAAQRLSRQR